MIHSMVTIEVENYYFIKFIFIDTHCVQTTMLAVLKSIYKYFKYSSTYKYLAKIGTHVLGPMSVCWYAIMLIYWLDVLKFVKATPIHSKKFILL